MLSRPYIARLILCLALLLLQQGALAHGLSHLGDTPHEDETGVVHTCDLCHAYSLAQCTADRISHAVDCIGSYPAPFDWTESFIPRIASSAQARGPPSAL